MKRLRAAAPWIGYAMGGVAAFALSLWAAVSYVGIALLFATFKAPRKLLWILLLAPLLTVPVASFLWGTAGYVTGTARLWTFGRVGIRDSQPDRQTRCLWRSSGCVVDGSEDFWQHPYNQAVRWLTRLFGPMPGAYDGYYPTPEEARAIALEPLAWIPSDRFQEQWSALTSAEYSRPEWDRDSCLIYRSKWKVVRVGNSGILIIRKERAWLHERESGRIFARYWFEPVPVP